MLAKMSEKIKQKRVLFIITQSEFGGAQRFLFELIKGIQRGPYEILLAIGCDGNDIFINEMAKLGINMRSLSQLKRNPNPIADIASVWQVRNLVRSWKPDTVFLNSSKAGFVGSLGTWLSGLKPSVIYRIGGWTFNDPWPAWKRRLWVILERLSAYWKDYIIVNNSHDLEQARQLGIKPRKEVLLVHNGIDPYKLDLFSKDIACQEILSLITKETGQTIQPKNIIGTIANFYPSKGLTYLVQAMTLVTDTDTVFAIIGDGEERFKLEKQIATAGLSDRVFLLGQLPNASRYLNAFSIFVLPSLKEGFPWSVLEAMSAKLPVIATSVGAIPEIIESGSNGYIVTPADPITLADKINLLISNEHLAGTMSIQAHQTVVLKFSLERMLGQIKRML